MPFLSEIQFYLVVFFQVQAVQISWYKMAIDEADFSFSTSSNCCRLAVCRLSIDMKSLEQCLISQCCSILQLSFPHFQQGNNSRCRSSANNRKVCSTHITVWLLQLIGATGQDRVPVIHRTPFHSIRTVLRVCDLQCLSLAGHRHVCLWTLPLLIPEQNI